ncbi:MAG TPA: hypothetical protein VHF23_05320 [Gaiellaceae bacterium]|nr:hypothetical protein [Gaiellaceae bacterium]
MLFRKRTRLRALTERECYLRLHGTRLGDIEVIPGPREPARGPLRPPGPSDEGPAVHLVFAFPRGAGTMSGEELRRELLRRMESRAGEAA